MCVATLNFQGGKVLLGVHMPFHMEAFRTLHYCIVSGPPEQVKMLEENGT